MYARALICILAALTTVMNFGSLGCGGGDDDGGGPCAGTDTATCSTLPAPNVAGNYVASEWAITSSNCPSEITQGISDNFVGQIVPTEIEQNGNIVDLHDPGVDSQFVGCVDATGTISVSDCDSQTEQGCTITATATITVNLASTPSNGQLAVPVDLSGDCAGLSDCAVVLGFTIDDAGGGAAVVSGAPGSLSGSVRNALAAALHVRQ